MAQNITSHLSHINNYLSSSTNESRVTTRKDIKLHSSDIPFLRLIHFFHTKGNGCYLKRAQWPQKLVEFGGKPLTYRVLKTKRRKLEELGYVQSIRERGLRNKEYTIYLTKFALENVNNWKKTAPQKRKNSPSKLQKQPLEIVKTAPPLNHDQINDNHAKSIVEDLGKKDTELVKIFLCFTGIGLYPLIALKAIKSFGKQELFNAYELTRKRRPLNPGAYLCKLLKLYIK